jgi:hypothetical protein
LGQPSIEESYGGQVSYIEYGGVAYSGVVTGTFSPLLADAPGGVPAFRGMTEKISGLALSGQTQLNQMVGNAYANANSRYPAISMDMATPVRNLDIAPYEVIRAQINPTDTVRGIALDRLYIPDGLSWKYDPENQILASSLSGINLVNGAVGETIVIPDTPVDAGFESPPANIPPLPIMTYPALFSNAVGASLAVKSVWMTSVADIASGADAYFHPNTTAPFTIAQSRVNVGDTLLSEVAAPAGKTVWKPSQEGNYLVIARFVIIPGTAIPTTGWIECVLRRSRTDISANYVYGVSTITVPVSGWGSGEELNTTVVMMTKCRISPSEGFSFNVINYTNADVRMNYLDVSMQRL